VYRALCEGVVLFVLKTKRKQNFQKQSDLAVRLQCTAPEPYEYCVLPQYNNVVNWRHQNPSLVSNVVPCEKSSIQWFLYKKFFNKPAKRNSDFGIFHPVVCKIKLINFINFVKRNFVQGKTSYNKNVKIILIFLEPLLYFDPSN